MKSEAARGIIRIVANYARLMINLVLGLAFMPFMFHWVGMSAVGLIGLLGAGTGVAAMFREITDRTVVRELGAAHHSGDERAFRVMFNSALLISTLLCGVVLLVFGALFLMVPFLVDKDPSLWPAARVMVLTQGGFTALVTLVSPIFNMQVITECFVRYNIWAVADRTSLLGGALFTRFVLKTTDAGQSLIDWSFAVVAIQAAALAVPMVVLLAGDRRLRPRLSMATRESARGLFDTVRWYLGFAVSENLYERVGLFLTTKILGLEANAIFFAAVSFVAYISQAAIGVSQGLDAVSARLESKGGRSLQALMFHSTRLLALVSFPTGVLFFVLAPYLVQRWIGSTIVNPEKNINLIAANVQIMCLPLIVRSIANGWTSILYGAGFLRRYAPMILVAALLNPLVMWLTLKAFPSVYAVSLVFAGVYTFIYFGLLPGVAAKCLGIRTRDLFIPMGRPLIATAACAPVLFGAEWAFARFGVPWTPVALIGLVAVFGGAYAGVSAAFVLDPAERQRFLWKPVSRLAGRTG